MQPVRLDRTNYGIDRKQLIMLIQKKKSAHKKKICEILYYSLNSRMMMHLENEVGSFKTNRKKKQQTTE